MGQLDRERYCLSVLTTDEEAWTTSSESKVRVFML